MVVSYRLWQGRFGGRADVIGSTVRLNGRPNTVVGVMPPGRHFPGKTHLWQLVN